MIAIIIFSPIDEERSSCRHCVGRHLQSSALLLFSAFPKRGSQAVSHIKRTPECLNTSAALSAQKNQQTFLMTELGPSPPHGPLFCYKNNHILQLDCSFVEQEVAPFLWSAVAQSGGIRKQQAVFSINLCIIGHILACTAFSSSPLGNSFSYMAVC